MAGGDRSLKGSDAHGELVATEKHKGRGHEYLLTKAGIAIRPVLEALADWGGQYVQSRLGPEDCDPALLFWAIRRYADRSALPARRFVMRFEFRNLTRHRRSMTTWWLVWERDELEQGPVSSPAQRLCAACEPTLRAGGAPAPNVIDNEHQSSSASLWLSNRIFTGYENLVDHCCDAWTKLVQQPCVISHAGPDQRVLV